MRPSSFFGLVLTVLAALAVGGCVSGQTGSPDCAGPTECLCSTLYSGGNVLRVHVESSAAGKLTAVVDQDIASIFRSPPVAPGVRIAGSLSVEKPCAPSETSATLVGADLLVFFFHSGDPSDGVFVWAVPWSDTLDFGADHLLGSSELDVLSSPDTCTARFPYGPAPACDDTRTVLCSVAQLNPQPDYPDSALLSVVFLGALLRRLSRRRPRR